MAVRRLSFVLATIASVAPPASAQVCVGAPAQPGEYSVGFAYSRSNGTSAYEANVTSFRRAASFGVAVETFDTPIDRGNSSYGHDTNGNFLAVSRLANFAGVGVALFAPSVPFLCFGAGAGIATPAVDKYYVNRFGQIDDVVTDDGRILSAPAGVSLGKGFAFRGTRLVVAPTAGVTYILQQVQFAEYGYTATDHDWRLEGGGGIRFGRVTAMTSVSKSLRFEDDPVTWSVGLTLAWGGHG